MRFLNKIKRNIYIRQLHLHIISTDFDSDKLKTPKHWNSFTTPFLVDVDLMIKIIETEGHFIILDVERSESNSDASEKPVEQQRDVLTLSEYHHLEKQPMVCYKCNAPLKSVPLLKQHLPLCEKKSKKPV